ncbi:hypothetical protein CAEBREN_01768 [Caenorhabditis brenneri]|uniref:Uncharacterized protein n=1 Tax=Caenorhabditis brenneri TaxID=135651 RepID=G0P521_CAEBE|nr:hypothetical protein CAEBREN_01768 [Caenorhabditis brenneri]
MAILKATLISQKRQITAFANTAKEHLTDSQEVLLDINSGVSGLEEIREKILDCLANSEGSLERLEDLDQWIQMEIAADPVTAANVELAGKYTRMMREYADQQRDYPRLIRQLKYVTTKLAIIVETEEEWQAKPPTPRKRLDEIDSRWNDLFEEDNDSVYGETKDLDALVEEKVEKILRRSELHPSMDDKKKENFEATVQNFQRKLKEMEKEAKKEDIKKKEQHEQMMAMEAEIRKLKMKVKEENMMAGDKAKENVKSGSKTVKKEKRRTSPGEPTRKKSSDSESLNSSDESSEDNELSDKNLSSDFEEETKTKKKKHKRQMLKLRLQEPPKFDGTDITVYEEFRAIFMEGYGKRNDLSAVTKLIQLKSCLSGEAKDLLASIQLKGRNFKLAMEILDDNYLTRAKPVANLDKRFRKMAIHQKDYKQMKKDASKMFATIYEMQNRGVNINMPYIYDPLIAKFPAEIAEELAIKVQSSKFKGDFKKVQNWINKILNAKIAIQERREVISSNQTSFY